MRRKEESTEKQEERLNKIGKEKLLEEIEKNAREEAESIVEKAETTARQKVEAAEGKAKRLEREALERADARAEQIRKHTEQAIEVKRRRVRLQQNEELLGRVFDRVRQIIEERVADEEYARVCEDWTVEAVIGLDVDRAVIAASSAEKPYLTDAFLSRVCRRVEELNGKKVHITLAHEEEKEYGVVARSEDGRLEYRNQVETRLHRNRSYYRKLIYRKLAIEGTK